MATKLLLGAHTSAAGGAPNALLEGAKIGATTIQLFTSNQKQWAGRKISQEEIDLWQKTLDQTEIEQVMSHDSYLINLGSPKKELREKSKKAFKTEIERCHLLNLSFMNFHPGVATSASDEECLENIVESLLEMESLIHEGSTMLLLETTAGQGTTVGHKFEHLGMIIQNVSKKIPIGVCIDTCHIFAAGYDIRTEESCTKVLQEFDDAIGLKYLKAFHFNDSLKDLGSRVDRHAPLGEGKIGIEGFKFFMTSKKTRDLPKYMETPGGPPNWEKEISLLKSFA